MYKEMEPSTERCLDPVLVSSMPLCATPIPQGVGQLAAKPAGYRWRLVLSLPPTCPPLSLLAAHLLPAASHFPVLV